MDVSDNHGTLHVHVPPPRRLATLAAVMLTLALVCVVAMLVEPMRSHRVVLPLLATGGSAAAALAAGVRRLAHAELLQIGLFVRTGREDDTLNVRSSDLLAVGKDEAPPRLSRAGLLAACGVGAGRLRLHTSRGDFLFGAALTDDDLTRLVWRLTPICRDNLRPRGNAHNHHHK